MTPSEREKTLVTEELVVNVLTTFVYRSRGYSSVVEHPAAIRQVLGSTPSVP